MEMTLFDFSRESDASAWFSINDVVMGGPSSSRLEIDWIKAVGKETP